MVVPCSQCYAHRGLSPLLTELLLSHSLICILLIATDACQRSLGVVNLKLRSLALEIPKPWTSSLSAPGDCDLHVRLRLQCVIGDVAIMSSSRSHATRKVKQ